MCSHETGQITREWEIISLDQAAGRISSTWPCSLLAGLVEKLYIYGDGFPKGAVVYINDQERETQVVNESEAIVTLLEKDVETPGPIELSILNSKIGIRSPMFIIFVDGDNKGEDLDVDVTNENGTKQEKVIEKNVPMDENHAGKVFFPEKKGVVVQEISRMRVTCYHEALETIYYFDFFDDLMDFKNSSKVFNHILASIRFLD